MIVIIKSQCGKKALIETRRVLDQFFERAGDRTWEGPVTQEGLKTVRMLLRKTARRNTAVVCHRVRGRHQVEMEWIVGNARKFNAEGRVPTNATGRDVLRSASENQWHTAEAIALMAGIAGLFHDFGKANALFQRKLNGQGPGSEPLRHEWLSLLLFASFVGHRSDSEWLQALAQVTPEDDQRLAKALAEWAINPAKARQHPFVSLPMLAQSIGWLIVSHHKLPQFRAFEGRARTAPELERLTLTGNNWESFWNSPQVDYAWDADDWSDLFTFSYGTPVCSQIWCSKARDIAKRALRNPGLHQHDWLQDDLFSTHLARLSLMLADHSYSAGPASIKWQSKDYPVHANTDRDHNGKRVLKQRLDEHNIGVGQNALLLARQLPRLRQQLPSIGRHKTLRQRTSHKDYNWQNKAFELSQSIAERSREQGFFGINMASTGKGKTFANARIMYGLSDERSGCRFSVALGLRTLTLQTGDALRERLHLDDDELAVLVGSQAVQVLHGMRKDQSGELANRAEQQGSESASDLLEEHQHVSYEGTLSDGPLRRWLAARNPQRLNKSLQLLSAPVLVCTIDHLIPATEGVRGGKQITPMLRLLTSDLVLDEPDDFDAADLPALCRLVNWAGLLGSRVLLSSATLPPVLISSLFDAYQSGRQQYDHACGQAGKMTNICCAWFDEYDSQSSDHAETGSYAEASNRFVEKRISRLREQNTATTALRKGELLSIGSTGRDRDSVIQAVSQTLVEGMMRLHQQHHQTDPLSGKQVSLGLLRIANISPLVAIAQQLIRHDFPADYHVHLCVYHSQHPLLIRSRIEARLDATLSRQQPDALWSQPEIRQALEQYPEQHHLFVVLGSPVTEVGRDHDYDWAIAEPSSMRSLIQLAGRIQRHRKQVPQQPNLLILNSNIRSLTSKESVSKTLAYCRPGFEARVIDSRADKQHLILTSKHLNDILKPDDYRCISAIPRIEFRKGRTPQTSLVDLEHIHLKLALNLTPNLKLARGEPADRWWSSESPLTWHGEMQRRTPFRQSSPEECFVLYQEDETEKPLFRKVLDNGELSSAEKRFARIAVSTTRSISPWIEADLETLIAQTAQALSLEVADVSRRFCEIHLRQPADNNVERWNYHPWLGVFAE
ncbi:type I-F CRISPR-associated helicase Cas3f [Oceanobacter antarcticus]|uniref:Type I-F CRISPR-associated helicase Cas3f n=1 Tax=Oceanobacter antarcticus TaxID=3133425 RepID=A0ABW8NFY9_9GAMM